MRYTLGMKTKTFVLVLAVVAMPVFAEDEDDAEESSQRKVANFIGAVLGKSGAVTGRNTGITSDGEFVSYNGQGFATSRGYYGANRNQTWGSDGLIVKSSSLYYGSKTTWQNGNSYTGEDNESSWVVVSQNPD